MKVLLLLIGIGAALFGGAHVLMLVGTLLAGGAGAQLGPTRLLAHVVGAAVGLLIAVVCFRKWAGNKKPAAAQGG